MHAKCGWGGGGGGGKLFPLTLSTLGKIFSRRHFEIFSYFSQKTGFDFHANCPRKQDLTFMQIVGDNLHESQILFSGKNKKKY